MFDFLLWYGEYFTTRRQVFLKTKNVTSPEAIFLNCFIILGVLLFCYFMIILYYYMPGILHSAKGPLSQGAEQGSCVYPDVASWIWSDIGFPNSAEAEVDNAVPDTNLHLVVV